MVRCTMGNLLWLALCLLSFKYSTQHDQQITLGCHYKAVTLLKPNLSEADALEFLSYGQVWFRGNDSNKQLIIWADNEQLAGLTTRLDHDGIQHLVSEGRICYHQKSDSEVHLPIEKTSRKIPKELYSETRSKLQTDGNITSVIHQLVVDYGDGSVYTNLFYSLKVVISSETKRFTLGKGNSFVLGSLRSRKGLWAFERSETDGVFYLRNRAALKSNDVAFDNNCFSDEAKKPCLVLDPYSSPGGSANPLRFKLTAAESTGVNIYATDGSKENCLEYAEYPSGLFQIVLSDDNQNCAIFIPTLKADTQSNSFFNITNQQDTKSATLLEFHDNFTSLVAKYTAQVSSCFKNVNDFKDVALVASYKNAKPSKVLFKNLLNVVSNFFPEAEDCAMAEGTTEMKCKFNQRLRNDVEYDVPASTNLYFDSYISIHDRIEYEFSETVEAYMIAEILISCDKKPCTRVLKHRLPDDLVRAVVPSKILRSRTGTIKLAKGMVFEHRLVDENSNTDPPEVCT